MFRSAPGATLKPQDCKQILFAGVHADIGGGYPETQSAISKFPLGWMIAEAEAHGLLIDAARRDHMVLGINPPESKTKYAAPDAAADIQNSMNAAWRLLEFVPKRTKYRENPGRRSILGFYLPLGEARDLSSVTLAHVSVKERIERYGRPRPPNLPANVAWTS
jgi:hypothetical protein